MASTCVQWKWAFLEFTGQCEEIQSSQREGREFLSSETEREKSKLDLTAGSEGRGAPLLVSPYSAVPGFIGPFTITPKQTWAKQPCVEQMGLSGTFFLALSPQTRPVEHRSALLKSELLIQVCSGEVCLSLASDILCLVGPGCCCSISHCYPAEASKAAAHTLCVSPSCQLVATTWQGL